MAYDLYPQTNNKISTTSSDIFEPTQNNLTQTQTQTQIKSRAYTQVQQFFNKNNIIPILFITRLLLHMMFVYLLLTSKKYKTLYNSNTKKIYVVLNLLLSYIQIAIIIYALYRLKKNILQIFKNNISKTLFIISIILFIIYIISVIQLTYILINIDKYNCKDITFLTKYYTFMQILSIFISFSILYKLYKSYK
jgi:hypothetical protein